MRTRRPILAALALVLVALAGTVADPAKPVVATHDGLLLSAAARYELLPAERAVRVTVDATVRSVTPDTATHQVYYTSISIPVQPGAAGIRASAAGAPIGAVAVETTIDYTAIEVTFGTGVFFGQSYAFQLVFDLPETGGEPGQEVRVGSSFAAFPVWAFGTHDEGNSVTVALPPAYEPTLLAGELQATPADDGATMLRADGIADPAAFFAYVTAERPGARERRELRIDVAGETARVLLLAWEDDPDWLERMQSVLETGLPRLGEAIGLDLDILSSLRVREQAFARLGDYAGTFDPVSDAIDIRYDADAFVALHEAAHIWFNGALFEDRWIGEAFASYYAERVGLELGLEVATFELTPELREAAFPLNRWGRPGREDLDREDYAYAATLVVGRRIAELAGDDGLRDAWTDADASVMAYQPMDADEPDRGIPDSVEGWMRLLDLLEQHSEADFDPIWEEWIVTAAQARRLDAREAARDAYASLVDSADGWEMPRSLRLLMETWRFDRAEAMMGEIDALLDLRTEIERRATGLRLEPPPDLREAFETDGVEAAEDMARAELAALGELERAAARLGTDPAPVELAGLLFEADPARALDEARRAYEGGRPTAAQEAAGAAIAGRAAAADRGTLRVVAAGAILLVLDAAAMAGLAIRQRRHLPRSLAA